MTKPLKIILTCEHASHTVPRAYQRFMSSALLLSHRGWDKGAAELARVFSRKFKAPLQLGKYSRLLVDLNRSLDHPKLSYLTGKVPTIEIMHAITKYYQPFRDEAFVMFKNAVKKNQVLHISVHSFTRKLGNDVRTTDIGILFDPRRPSEKRYAELLRREIAKQGLRVRMNYPYTGRSDGHTTFLRTQFSDKNYLGFELEVCNDCLVGSKKAKVARALTSAIPEAARLFTAAARQK